MRERPVSSQQIPSRQLRIRGIAAPDSPAAMEENPGGLSPPGDKERQRSLAGRYTGGGSRDGPSCRQPYTGNRRSQYFLSKNSTIACRSSWLACRPPTPAGPTRSSTPNCENVGWPQLVQAVHRVWVPLPLAQRVHTVIFTANYSEASAINNLGAMLGIHTAVGGHNSEWWWRSGNPA